MKKLVENWWRKLFKKSVEKVLENLLESLLKNSGEIRWKIGGIIGIIRICHINVNIYGENHTQIIVNNYGEDFATIIVNIYSDITINIYNYPSAVSFSP